MSKDSKGNGSKNLSGKSGAPVGTSGGDGKSIFDATGNRPPLDRAPWLNKQTPHGRPNVPNITRQTGGGKRGT